MDDNYPVHVPPANPTERVEWDQRLVVDVALGASEDTLLDAYGLQAHQLKAIRQDPLFGSALAKLKKELETDGMSFKLKAKLQAEAMLEEHWTLVHDREINPETRRKAIADTVRWAGFDSSAGQATGGSGFQINLILPGAVAPGVTIEGEKR